MQMGIIQTKIDSDGPSKPKHSSHTVPTHIFIHFHAYVYLDQPKAYVPTAN